MRQEFYVRFCEGLRGWFPRVTRLSAGEINCQIKVSEIQSRIIMAIL